MTFSHRTTILDASSRGPHDLTETINQRRNRFLGAASGHFICLLAGTFNAIRAPQSVMCY